ncbi:unnamed protein product [Peronospora farinosa]|nr:unnamed protein product [Peronospora farinosa]CAI5705624.1 unnamed protein product [Peronospora farinosa]
MLHNINVKPIVYPAVEEGKCRLRFFISALHTPKQLEDAVIALKTYLCDKIDDVAVASPGHSNVNGTATNGVAKVTIDSFKTEKKTKSQKEQEHQG